MLRTLPGKVSTWWIFADWVNEWSKTWKASGGPITLHFFPNSQTPGYWLHRLPSMPLPSPSQAPTHSLRVYKWRHSPQCQEAPDPRISLIARLSRWFSSSLSWYPPEFDLSAVMCLWLFYFFSYSAHSTIQLYTSSFLSKAPISFLSDLKCLSEKSAKSLRYLVPPQTTSVSPHLLFSCQATSFSLHSAQCGHQSGFFVGLFCFT